MRRDLRGEELLVGVREGLDAERGSRAGALARIGEKLRGGDGDR